MFAKLLCPCSVVILPAFLSISIPTNLSYCLSPACPHTNLSASFLPLSLHVCQLGKVSSKWAECKQCPRYPGRGQPASHSGHPPTAACDVRPALPYSSLLFTLFLLSALAASVFCLLPPFSTLLLLFLFCFWPILTLFSHHSVVFLSTCPPSRCPSFPFLPLLPSSSPSVPIRRNLIGNQSFWWKNGVGLSVTVPWVLPAERGVQKRLYTGTVERKVNAADSLSLAVFLCLSIHSFSLRHTLSLALFFLSFKLFLHLARAHPPTHTHTHSMHMRPFSSSQRVNSRAGELSCPWPDGVCWGRICSSPLHYPSFGMRCVWLWNGLRVCVCVPPPARHGMHPCPSKYCLCVAIDSMAPASSGTAASSSMSRSVYKGCPCALLHMERCFPFK